MTRPDLRRRLRDLIGLGAPESVAADWGRMTEHEGYRRQEVRYASIAGDMISAFLLTPSGAAPAGGVVAFHQHAGQFHLGKSEVAGDAGAPLQAFGPALARRGLAVLAPDAITFEDRRAQTDGTDPDDGDWLQHFNAMAYRLIEGDVLMRTCLDDAQRALSVLLQQDAVDPARVGVVGHSYGGTTALYHAAIDERCQFAGVSGALCSFGARQRAGTGINMFEVVPGIAGVLDASDLVESIAPRPLLVVSSTDDPYSADADLVIARSLSDHVTEIRAQGPHALDQDRFDAIVEWIVTRATG